MKYTHLQFRNVIGQDATAMVQFQFYDSVIYIVESHSHGNFMLKNHFANINTRQILWTLKTLKFVPANNTLLVFLSTNCPWNGIIAYENDFMGIYTCENPMKVVILWFCTYEICIEIKCNEKRMKLQLYVWKNS